MLTILSTDWVLRCRSLAEKHALLAYAAGRGVPVWDQARADGDLDLGMGYPDFGPTSGTLVSYPHDPREDTPEVVYWTEAQFREACDRYAGVG